MLQSLSLTNFRSYTAIDLSFEDNLTVIVGPNAVGKTNLLESVFVSSTSKSFRASDAELINNQETYYRIEASFDSDRVELSLSENNGHYSKQLKLNNKRQSLHYLLGRNPVTLFEPHDMNLFESVPESRRRYLDTVLSQIYPQYAKTMLLYKKALKQRNSLLHSAKIHKTSVHDDELFVWDVQLSEHAQYIFSSRRDYIASLSPLINDVYGEIAGVQTDIHLKYVPNADLDQEDLMGLLVRARHKDLAVGYTTCGPHRDDFYIAFKESDIVSTASRGEMRTAILALKIAEMRYIMSILHKTPILLLDDVFSELDSTRRRHLMHLIADQQTILTTTELDKNIPKNSFVINLSGVSQ